MDKETYQLLCDISAGRLTPEGVRTRVGIYEDRIDARCRAIKSLLETIPGEDPGREGLIETPLRVARMYEEIFGGYEMDPYAILNKTFAADGDTEESIYNNGIVAVKEIPFYSHCEHHMVPFIGHAWIAYIPNDRVVGLSKLARVVECYARRLQIQERMTSQIADVIDEVLQPQGVMVVLKAEHLCMAMRGVKKPGTKTVTSCVRGVFCNEAARMECMNLLGLGK